MGTPNFSNQETQDLFDCIASCEEDRGYFQNMAKIWLRKLGMLAASQMLQEVKIYASEIEGDGFRFHSMSSESVAKACLCEIADFILQEWGRPTARRVLGFKRIDGEVSRALDFDLSSLGASSSELILGAEAIFQDEVAGDYGQILIDQAKVQLSTQRQVIREIH